jgi:hypothetical protein
VMDQRSVVADASGLVCSLGLPKSIF